MKFHVLQARYGDCFILEYGTKSKPKFMLIDGGPARVFDDYLKPELEYIASKGGNLDVVALSHVDRDHVTGLLNFFVELRENDADGKDRLIGVEDLWINSFDKAIDVENEIESALNRVFSNSPHNKTVLRNTEISLDSIKEGNRLKLLARALDIPINKKFKGKLATIDKFKKPFKLGNITIQIVGPTQKNLDELKQDWIDWFKDHEDKLNDRNPSIAGYTDKTAPNLSSLMFLVSHKKKTILFTGDGRGDHLIEGLEMIGKFKNNKFCVDVLKIGHHGSDHNVTPEFFEQIRAKTYVISGDGSNDNPEFTTLKWIVEAAKKREEQITLYVTNKTENVDKLLDEFDPKEFDYELYYLSDDATSMEVKF